MRILTSMFVLTLMGCGSSTSSLPVAITGSLNDTPVTIEGGFCKTVEFANGFGIVAGENTALPTGFIMIFDTFADVAEGEFILPHDKVTAGYNIAATATGGKITLTVVTKVNDVLKSIAGSAALDFDGSAAAGGTTGAIAGSFLCTF